MYVCMCACVCIYIYIYIYDEGKASINSPQETKVEGE